MGGKLSSYDGLSQTEIEEVQKETGFTVKQIIHLHKRFKYFDADNDNHLRREDFLFRPELSINPLSDCIIHAFFTEESGSIEETLEFRQFARILARFLPINTNEKEIGNGSDPANGTDCEVRVLTGNQAHSTQLNSKEEKLRFAFKMYDKDGDNFISRDELLAVVHMLIGSEKSHDQLDNIADRTIEEADTDHDGKISFEEFISIMSKVDTVKKMTLKFKD